MVMVVGHTHTLLLGTCSRRLATVLGVLVWYYGMVLSTRSTTTIQPGDLNREREESRRIRGWHGTSVSNSDCCVGMYVCVCRSICKYVKRLHIKSHFSQK